MNKQKRKERMQQITKDLDALCHNAVGGDGYCSEAGWNSLSMRIYIAAKFAAMEEANTSLAEKLEFEKTVGERVVKVFKDAIKQDEKSSS